MFGDFHALYCGVFGQWTERESHIYLYFISSPDQQHTLLKISDPYHYQNLKIKIKTTDIFSFLKIGENSNRHILNDSNLGVVF